MSIFGYTLLELLIRHYDPALAEENYLVFEMLLEHGADPNIPIDKHGKTILDKARKYPFYPLFLRYA